MDELFLLNYLPFSAISSYAAAPMKCNLASLETVTTSILEDPKEKVRATINLIHRYLLPLSQDTLDSLVVEINQSASNSQEVLVTLESPSGIEYTVIVQTNNSLWEQLLLLSAREIYQISAG